MEIDSHFLWFVLAGFVAQLIDGALGMAYGVSASSLLLSFGLPPAVVSSTVHAAECFSTGASAVSHKAFGNVNSALFRRLLIPGVVGAVVGAYFLASFPGETLRPFIAVYLLVMGGVIIVKAFREFPRVPSRRISSRSASPERSSTLSEGVAGVRSSRARSSSVATTCARRWGASTRSSSS